jgi:formylglycine-generating enzyme required for sulfatase activity
MKKQASVSSGIQQQPASPAPPLDLRDRRGGRHSWRWLIGLAVMLAAGFGVLAALGVDWDSLLAPADDMVLLPGGAFEMGSSEPRYPEGTNVPVCTDGRCGGLDSLPVHTVELDPFWIDRTPVTNAQFARFVKAKKYVTLAERSFDGLVAGSFVFRPPAEVVSLKDHRQWWVYVPGADWRHPEGPGSDINGRDNHPVVQIAWEDAAAYAEWAGKRLPTEAEFEYAARGGLKQQRFVWGDELTPDGKWMANIWQGRFPLENTKDDGYVSTSPVKAFPPNGFGLYDMSGNIWQWCSDWYRPEYYADSPRKNPQGPTESYDPSEFKDPENPQLGTIPKRVQRGGSFLCSDLYCKGYMPGSRGKGEPVSAANHIGFRCVRSAK